MRRLLFALIAAPLLAPSLLAQATSTPAAAKKPFWVDTTNWDAITTSYLLSPDGQEGPTPDKPFTATELRYRPNHTNGIANDHLDTNKVYRDAQGRMRVQGSHVILIFDPISNKTYTLRRPEKDYRESPAIYGRRETAHPTAIAVYGPTGYVGTTGDFPGPVRQVGLLEIWGWYPAKFTPTNHFAVVDLGTQTINGQVCKGTRVTLTIPALPGSSDIHVIQERWYSDDLQALVKSTYDDPRYGINTYELKDITRAAPDPGLFKLPAGYTPTTNPNWVLSGGSNKPQ